MEVDLFITQNCMQNNCHVLTRLASVRFWGCAISAGCEGLKELITQVRRVPSFRVRKGRSPGSLSGSRRCSMCRVCRGLFPGNVTAPGPRHCCLHHCDHGVLWPTEYLQMSCWHMAACWFGFFLLFSFSPKEPSHQLSSLSMRLLGKDSNRQWQCSVTCLNPPEVASQLLLFHNWWKCLWVYLHLKLLPWKVKCFIVVPWLHWATLCCSQRISLNYFS